MSRWQADIPAGSLLYRPNPIDIIPEESEQGTAPPRLPQQQQRRPAERGYVRLALWLQPSRPQCALIGRVMDQVRSLPFPSPPAKGFPPHVTILSGLTGEGMLSPSQVEILWHCVLDGIKGWKAHRASHCSGRDAPQAQKQQQQQGEQIWRVPLLPPETKGKYYQAIVLPVQLTPELQDLHERIHMALSSDKRLPPPRSARGGFWPHLSLAYAHVDMMQGQALLDQLGQQGIWVQGQVQDPLWDRREERGPLQAHVPQEPGGAMDRVQFTRLGLWSCEGEVEQWERIYEVTLEDIF